MGMGQTLELVAGVRIWDGDGFLLRNTDNVILGRVISSPHTIRSRVLREHQNLVPNDF